MANNPASTLGQAATGYTPVQDFTPEKQSPAFSGPISEIANVQTYTTTTVNLTTADVQKIVLILTNGSAITANLPTAAALIPTIEGARGGLNLGINAAGGSSIDFFIKAGGAGTVTLVAGTGGTIVGTATVATLNIKHFKLVTTNAGSATPTYTVYSLGTSVY